MIFTIQLHDFLVEFNTFYIHLNLLPNNSENFYTIVEIIPIQIDII